MDLNFQEALANIDATTTFMLANQTTPGPEYLWSTFLPERQRETYDVSSGSMTVRSTMAGMSGMDSPYAIGGRVEMSTFMEKSTKLTIDVPLPEETLRELQTLARRLGTGSGAIDSLVDEMLNFYEKVVIEALITRDEWLRGQALTTGALTWEYNGKTLAVDYGIPAGNVLAVRTTASTEAYGAAGSLFWTDVQEAQRLLRNNVQAIVAHPDTINEILYNPANSLQLVAQSDNMFTVQKLDVINGLNVPSSDARNYIMMVAYGLEGEVLNPTDNTSARTPYIAPGFVVYIGAGTSSGYRVGQGSTPDPLDDLALGYHHMAPTVEGNGAPGRWGRLLVPENKPWELRGQAVENSLPVIENPEKIVIAQTEMA